MTYYPNTSAGDDPLPAPLSPRFFTKQIVATPGALAALKASDVTFVSLLARHFAGDWGSVPLADARMNDQALQSGGRLLSSYLIGAHVRIWAITESDRSLTTLLLPSEY